MTARPPDFIIIGAQKAGTTWLRARLVSQPGLFMFPKEIHFFDVPARYARGMEWYLGHFDAAPAGVVVGEKTPDYFWTNGPAHHGPAGIPERMHKSLPDARLIAVLRDPVMRAVSQLNHLIRARVLSPFVDPDAVLMRALDP